MVNADKQQHTRTAMTVAQKASLTSGANFWNTKALPDHGVPSIMLTDGPHGLRKQGGSADHLGLNDSIPATCFPTASALANTWDTALLTEVGRALGAESAAEDVAVLLGPGLNIKRNPLGGRNFEYLSEDPLVAGILAAALIRGIQSKGVSACVKHFAVNSQETHRMSIDEVVDERALHELYLEGFRIAIAEGDPWTLMTSYNKINGTYANENEHVLRDILHDTWGYRGMVVTDWGGNNDRVAGLKAGNALEMPSTGGVTDAEIVAAIEAGELDEDVLDARVSEILELIERTSRIDAPEQVDFDAHHELAVEAARRAAVLLRNENGILPLAKAPDKVAVIGDFAQAPRFQGAGSSLVKPTRVDNALDALRASDLDVIGFEPGFHRRDRQSAALRRKAVYLAQQSDIVLLFLGLDESAEAEGVDRTHMRLAENQLALVRELTTLDCRVVVVLAGGSPVELPFAEDVDAIVHGYLGGQGGGRAIVDVLTGAVNPGGKLAESYPIAYADVPSASSYALGEATAEHRESIYIGYRYFDKAAVDMRYPFGHGLSYTTFEYSDLESGDHVATVTVTNTGDRAGTEVVQLYVAAPDAAKNQIRAARELAAFAVVHLEPGESETVALKYAENAFDIYDVEHGAWVAIAGDYTIQVGASSQDIRLSTTLSVTGGAMPAVDEATMRAYTSGKVANVSDDEFATLLGRTPPPATWDASEPLTRASIVAQCRGRGGFASLLYRSIRFTGWFLNATGKPLKAHYTYFVLDLPFRALERMGAGRVDTDMVDGLLLMVNGHFWRGSRHLIAARRRLRRQLRAEAR